VAVVGLCDGSEPRGRVMAELAMETLGWSVGQTIRPGVPDCVASPPVREDLQPRRHDPAGGPPHHRQDGGTHAVNTVCGPVAVPNPRWQRCAGPREGQTFRPITAWRQGRTSPEWLYLKTKGASRIPFAKVADLLQNRSAGRSPDRWHGWRIGARGSTSKAVAKGSPAGVWGPSGEQRQIPCRHPNADLRPEAAATASLMLSWYW
jgi:hypothetical protein